jgi:hypothetical protein
MLPFMKLTLLNLPPEVRREILIHYLLLPAPEFEAPEGIQPPRSIDLSSSSAIPRPEWIHPQSFREIPETKPITVGEWSNFSLTEAIMSLMQVNNLLYN